MKIKIFRAGNEIYEKAKVDEFLERIDELIGRCENLDIDTQELIDFKKLVKLNNSYSPKDTWYVQEVEEKLGKVEEDLPF